MRQHLSRHKKILLALSLLVVLLLIYIFTGETLAHVGETVISGEKISGQHIVAMGIWLALAIMINIAVDSYIWEGIVRKRTGNPVPKLLKNTATTIIFLISIIFIVAFVYHKSITGLLATTGALGIVLGLALRGIIENAVQGVSLNVQQIFKTGDIISIPGKFDELSEVKDITMRNTYLQDFVGHIIAIPNSVVCSNIIRNYSHSKARIFSVCFSIVVGTRGLSIKDTLRVLNAALASTEFIVSDPPYLVLIADVQSTSVKYDLSCWATRDKVNPAFAKHILYSRIIEQLGIAGFDVGTPYIDQIEIEKKLAIMLHQVDHFSHLNHEQKEDFYKHEMADKQAIAVLKRVKLFSTLQVEEIEAITERMRRVDFKAGNKIITQGETGDLMYVLVEGALQVYIKAKDQEDLIPVTILTPGRYFGEMSMLVGDARSATIVALTDTLVYEISKELMSSLFEQHPDMLEKISEQIADQEMMNAMKQKEYSSPEVHHKKKGLTTDLVKRIKRFFWNK